MGIIKMMRHSYLLTTRTARFGFALVFAGVALTLVNNLFGPFSYEVLAGWIEQHAFKASILFLIALAVSFLVGHKVVRWVLRRRIAIILVLVILGSVDYKLAGVAAIATCLVMILTKLRYGTIARITGVLSMSHIHSGVRVLNTVAFMVFSLALINMPHLQADPLRMYFDYVATFEGNAGKVIVISSLVGFVYFSYQAGNRFFPLVFSSKYAIAIFFIALLIVNPIVAYTSFVIYGMVVFLMRYLAEREGQVAQSPSHHNQIVGSDFSQDAADGVSAGGIASSYRNY